MDRVTTGAWKGRKVLLTASDPWEFAHPDGSTKFKAEILDQELDASGGVRRLLVLLESPPRISGRKLSLFVIEATHGNALRDLLNHATVLCSATGVSAGEAAQGPPWGYDKWRGGPAAGGTLSLIESRAPTRPFVHLGGLWKRGVNRRPGCSLSSESWDEVAELGHPPLSVA
jgi:hypothetical protein